MGFSERKKPNADPAAAHHDEPNRGRHAETPTDVPRQGWLDVMSRTGHEISNDNLTIVAAGVAFYAFVALVPALAALIGLYGLLFDPQQVSQQVTSFARILPQEALPMLEQQLKRITSNAGTASLSATIGLVLAVWSSASATKALIQGLNISYGEREKRGFIKLNALALTLTFGVIVGALVAIALVAVLPTLLQHLSLGSGVETILNWSRWPILLGGFILGLAVFYRYGPSRDDAKWKWVSAGALLAAVLWIGGSALFSLYVSKFGSYDKTYGSLGAVVVFLMWMYLSAFVVLLGAEMNSELERQTLKDTTEGAPEPLGERGAHAADTVGPARHSRKAEGEPEKSRPPSRPRRS